MHKLTRFFIERPMFVNIAVIALFLLGVTTLLQMKKEGFPSVALNMVTITTLYPGASSKDVEVNVTSVIEEKLGDIANVKEILSTSQESLSKIQVIADDDLNPSQFAKVYDEIGNALASIQGLPPTAKSPIYQMISTDEMGILQIVLVGENRTLRSFIPYMESEIRKVKGVASVDTVGLDDEEYHIEIDPQKANENYVDLRQISQAISKRNVEGSGGSLESSIGERQIVAYSKFQSIQDVLDVSIRRNFEGGGVLLKDVATITRSSEDRKLIVRNGGRTGVSLILKKKANADIVATIDKVKESISKLHVPESIKINYFNDKSEFTRNRIKLLLGNAAVGMLLVFLILLFALDFRTACWTSFSIPLSFMGTFLILDLLGMSITSIVLGGCVLVIGMLVDDAIVMAEQVNSEKENGYGGKDSSVRAVKKVWLPIFGASLTTMIAYSPIAKLGGLPGKFVWAMPAVVCIALFMSLIDTYFLLPVHLAHGKPVAKTKKRFMTIAENFYEKVLLFVKRFRYVVIGFFVVLFVSSLLVAKNFLKLEAFPQEAVDSLTIQVTQPAGITPQNALKNIEKLEKIIQTLGAGELIGVSSRIGTHSKRIETIRGTDTNLAIIFVYLSDFETRDRLASEILSDLRQKVNQSFQGEGIAFLFELIKQGPLVGYPIEVRIAAKTDELRLQKIKEVKEYLQKLEGVYDTKDDRLFGKPEINLLIDYKKLERMQITVEDVLTIIKISFDGIIVSNFVENNKNIDLRLKINKKNVKDLNFLKELSVANKEGHLIKFGNFVRFEERTSLAEINHIDGKRTVVVYAQLDKSKLSTAKANRKLKEKFKPTTEYQISIVGESKDNKELFGSLALAGIIAILGIYLAISLILNSFTLPFIVMSAIPFAISGILFAVWAHGMSLSMFAIISIIGLAGIIVNDSMVMIFTILDIAKKNGMNYEAIVEGAKHRLRAISLTTATTVVGLLPTGYAIGGYDPFISPMCLALAYGLMFGTFIVLILVPAFYFVKLDITGKHTN
ncbi:MAG: efflux RND transporter permease subunit [Spirochaetota bacterium]